MADPADRRSAPDRRRWPWAVALTAVALSIAAVAGFPPEERVFPLLNTPAIWAMAGVGALLLVRRPENRIGWLLLFAGGAMCGTEVLAWYALAGSTGSAPWPGASLAAIASAILWDAAIITALIGIPLIFPDGHLLSRRWGVIVWLVALGMIGVVLSTTFEPGPLLTSGRENPYGVSEWVAILGLLRAMAIGAATIAFGAGVAAIVIRYRAGSATTRQQLKWLIAVAAFGAIVFPLSYVAPSDVIAAILSAVGTLAFAAIPVAIAIAVLRYRLYEIDRVISRSIGWAIVSATLLTTFSLLVLVLQAVLEPLLGGNTLAIAGSTLVAAALFQPLRSRVQRAVDRRFDRSRHDGERLLAAFGERLRDEVDLATISAGVLATVDAAVRPTAAGLWLREREGGGA